MGEEGQKHLAFITCLILNYYLSTGIQKPASDANFCFLDAHTQLYDSIWDHSLYVKKLSSKPALASRTSYSEVTAPFLYFPARKLLASYERGPKPFLLLNLNKFKSMK